MTEYKQCPHCGKEILVEANKCKHCYSMHEKHQHELDAGKKPGPVPPPPPVDPANQPPPDPAFTTALALLDELVATLEIKGPVLLIRQKPVLQTFEY